MTPYMLTPQGYTLRTSWVEAFARLKYGTRADGPQRVAQALRLFRDYKAEIGADLRITDLTKQDLRGQLSQEVSRTVEGIRDQWRRLQEQALPGEPTLVPAAAKDATYHAAAARAWARTRQQLDAGIALETVLEGITDPVTLEALREEYPAYTAATFGQNRTAARAHLEAGQSLITERAVSLLPPEQQATYARRGALLKEGYAFDLTVNHALHEAGGGSPAPVVVGLSGEAVPV